MTGRGMIRRLGPCSTEATAGGRLADEANLGQEVDAHCRRHDSGTSPVLRRDPPFDGE